MLAAGAAVTTVALDLGYDNVSAFIAICARAWRDAGTLRAGRRVADPCAGTATQASEDAAVLRGRRGRAAVLRGFGSVRRRRVGGSGGRRRGNAGLVASRTVVGGHGVAAVRPAGGAARSWRRAWRPSFAVAWTAAGGSASAEPSCVAWLSSCACAAASERRSGAACDGRVDAKPALARDSSPLAPARLPRIQHPPTVTRAWPRARRPAPVRGRHPPPHHPAHALGVTAALAIAARLAPRALPAGRRANPARRLAPVRFLRGGGNGLIRRLQGRGAHALARRRTAGRCRGT